MGEKFLKRNEELEKFIGDNSEYVIVSLKDWESLRSALRFNRIKIWQGEIMSNTNFLFEMLDIVKLKEQETISDSITFKIVARIELYGYENNYLIIPSSNEFDDTSNIRQIPESEIEKYKNNGRTEE